MFPSSFLCDLVRYGVERQLGTHIDRCGRIRIIDVAASMLPIIDADFEHKALKTRTKKLLAEANPNPVEYDACHHGAATTRTFSLPAVWTHSGGLP